MCKFKESNFVRAAGMLYIRYVSPPDQLFQRLGPFLLDSKKLAHQYGNVNLGEFVEKLLSDK